MACLVRCQCCRLPLQPINERIDSEFVCPACALRIARFPLGPQRLQSRSYRDPHERALASEPIKTAEFWLKVAIHLAGIAALLASPAVAALLTHLCE